MGRFRSTRYPALIVADIGVHFVDGVAVVDARHDARLRQLRELGVVEDGAPASPAPTAPAAAGASPAEQPVSDDSDELAPPAGNASRDTWAAYAEKLGIPVPQTAKRDEIRVLIDSIVGDDDEDDEDADDVE